MDQLSFIEDEEILPRSGAKNIKKMFLSAKSVNILTRTFSAFYSSSSFPMRLRSHTLQRWLRIFTTP